MDVTWIEVLAGSLLAIALLVIPGAGCALLMRAPRPLVLISAPLLSISLIAGTAFLAPRFGMDWGWGALAIASVPVGLVCALIGGFSWWRDKGTANPEPSRRLSWEGHPLLVPLAMAVSGGVYLFRLIRAIGEPFAVSQTYDAPFHLNAVHSMLERHNASFLQVSLNSAGDNATFYPAVWHEIVSLVVLGTGLPIPAAVNAVTIALSTVLWPLAVAVCVGWIFRSWNAAALGALLAFSLSQMPTHFIWFGVLYPNLLSYILLLPMLTLAAYALLGLKETERRPLALLIAVGVTPAFAVAHPSGFFTFVLLVLPIVLIAALRIGAKAPGKLRWIAQPLALIAVVVAYLAVNQATFKVQSLAEMRANIWYWKSLGGIPGGLIRALTLTTGWDFRLTGFIPPLLGVLVILGAILLLRSTRGRWLPLSHLIVIALYLVAYAIDGPWRPYIIGMWYSDPQRFAAMVGITAVPLLACGVWQLHIWLAQILHNRGISSRLVCLGMSLLIFIIAQFSGALTFAFKEISAAMHLDTPRRAGTLSVQEYQLIEELPLWVPEGTILLGNPWNGSPYAPAISGVDVAFPHTVGYPDDEAYFLAKHLNDPRYHTYVCQILNKRHMTHILDFGPEYLWNGDPNKGHEKFPAFEEAYGEGNAHIVTRKGEAKLLRLTLCD